MKSNKLLRQLQSLTSIILLVGLVILAGCTKEEEEVEPTETINSGKSQTVTIGVYLLNGSTYEDQNKDLVFDTHEVCQSWSRTAQADNHSSSSHNHFNAARNTTYDSNTETISWTEYGPDLDQSSIDATCGDGSNGANKTANKTDYSIDKNFYLKIKSVLEK
jgi:hypothetical protein